MTFASTHPAPRPVSRADAAPLPRRFTVDEYRRMAEAGVFRRDERVELIGGEIVAMSPVGRHHEVLRSELLMAWARACPPELKIASESPLRLSESYEPVSDIYVLPADLLTPDARAGAVLLVVEIADSSLAYDTTTKAEVYAAHGVREYWVIDAKRRAVKVHRHPEPGGYATTFKIESGAQAVPDLAPSLAIRISDLPV